MPQITGSLPNLIIIGALKCGTTSLHYYLSQHPEIFMSKIKEIKFFSLDENWVKGATWYRSHFTRPAKIKGESSPDYTFYPMVRNTPERMSRLLPDAKLIYLVRDPIERIITQYMMRVFERGENRSLEEALSSNENNLYWNTSKYSMQIEQYLKYYTLEQILIVVSEELRDQRIQTLRSIFEFLGVENSFHSPKFDVIKNKMTPLNTTRYSIKKIVEGSPLRLLPTPVRDSLFFLYKPFIAQYPRPVFNQKMLKKAKSVLGDDINKFRELAGKKLAHWSI